ncbi:phenylacetate--CoA ligase family protein [Dendrosporobacter sp. 1207_IL3150]|uniref:phenylacetate--CoA ligase family protein n=1 Tax=Dendrosporobacter sp. 1207_IL3150 TaxID=3084054 RepID=UPI002FDB4A89
MILNTEIETMDNDARTSLQSQKFQTTIERVYEKTQFYYERFHAIGLSPANIKSIHDIHKLPFTTTTDLANNYPFGFLTMPVSGVARFEQTPDLGIAVGLTSRDIIGQQEMIARSLVSCYITITSVLMNIGNSPLSISARSLEQSAEMLGITVVANEANNFKNSFLNILNFGVTTIFSAPDTLLIFADFLLKNGIEIPNLPLMSLICEEQKCSEDLRKELTEKFQVPVYTIYGNSNVLSLGIAGECHMRQGLHVQDDHFYAEIINPDTGIVLKDQQQGELVITTISREAAPLIRFRTGDKAVITHEKCSCGRTSPRIIFIP